MGSTTRTVSIWITGLLASALTSAGVGALIGNSAAIYNADGTGLIAGIAAFTCLRLWLAERRNNPV
jgi:hypothetical protein